VPTTNPRSTSCRQTPTTASRAAGYDDGYHRYLEHLRAARPFWASRERRESGADPAPGPTTGDR
jgi:hypothetical protein